MSLAQRHFHLPASLALTVRAPAIILQATLIRRHNHSNQHLIYHQLLPQATFLDTPLSLSDSLAASRLPQRCVVRFTTASAAPTSFPVSADSSASVRSERVPSMSVLPGLATAKGGDCSSVPAAKRRKEEGGGWVCAVCTLENAASVARCDACETLRPSPNPAPAAVHPPAPSSASASSSAFTVLTINVWFDDYHDNLRMRRVASEVRRLQPDFLCLQEVNAKLLSMLDPALRQLGYSTQSALLHSYGEMLWWRASSVTNVQLFQEPFHDSQQGRCVHVVQCVVRGRPLAAATVHLESEAQNSSVRLAQLGRSLQRLRRTNVPFLLAGDTNLGKKDDAILARDKTMMDGVHDGGS